MQNQRIEQLDARTEQTEQRQANLQRIGGQHPQSLSERLIGKGFIDQPQQFRVEWIEDIRIEFALHGPACTAEQEGDQIGEGQTTRTPEIPAVTERRFEKAAL